PPAAAYPLFPYTTLFRSLDAHEVVDEVVDLLVAEGTAAQDAPRRHRRRWAPVDEDRADLVGREPHHHRVEGRRLPLHGDHLLVVDRKSTRLNSSHRTISY